MTEQEIRTILNRQREYFATGATLSRKFRAEQLGKLKASLQRHEEELNAALQQDLGKSRMESYMCEIGLTLSELTWMQKHLRGLMQEKRVPTPLSQFAAISFRSPSPYGTVLIMSPWNYPVLLTLDPLIDAIAAGNTAVVKPSAYAPATAAVLKNILEECFPIEYVAVITGGRTENQALLQQRFDMIFFTGGKIVGQEVLRSAAEYLTPVTLELGGKSPCIVDATAKLPLAARRIVFGKYLNCGQTCVAPDYVYCAASVKDALVDEMKKQIWKQFGDDPLANANYGRIVNEKHFRRLLGLIDPTKVVAGGVCDSSLLQIAPTIMDHVTFEDAVMQEEIFGPILPVMTFHSLDAVISQINHREHPLALYMFTESKANADRVMTNCGFGGGCINDTVIHLATSEMGFGGFGESGMGSYHGKTGFDTFSHYKSIVDKKTWLDLRMRYQPYNKVFDFLIRLFMH
mgnify:CR=1 FL=1